MVLHMARGGLVADAHSTLKSNRETQLSSRLHVVRVAVWMYWMYWMYWVYWNLMLSPLDIRYRDAAGLLLRHVETKIGETSRVRCISCRFISDDRGSSNCKYRGRATEYCASISDVQDWVWL